MSTPPPFNPGKPLIKLVLQSKEQALPEPVRIQSIKTYEWRRQALRSKNSHCHLPLMGITLDNLLLLLPFLSPGQNKEFDSMSALPPNKGKHLPKSIRKQNTIRLRPVHHSHPFLPFLGPIEGLGLSCPKYAVITFKSWHISRSSSSIFLKTLLSYWPRSFSDNT